MKILSLLDFFSKLIFQRNQAEETLEARVSEASPVDSATLVAPDLVEETPVDSEETRVDLVSEVVTPPVQDSEVETPAVLASEVVALVGLASEVVTPADLDSEEETRAVPDLEAERAMASEVVAVVAVSVVVATAPALEVETPEADLAEDRKSVV